MPAVIRIGDKTTHGGTVLSGSNTLTFMGIGVARIGDPVSCPEHGKTTIVEGDDNFLDQGIPIALEGHKCGCGCSLISSLSTVIIN